MVSIFEEEIEKADSGFYGVVFCIGVAFECGQILAWTIADLIKEFVGVPLG